jgi:D-arginine dehydrogenase
MADFDYIVIGAGMAGASAAYELADFGSVLVLEREDRPGYHTTGRSAALYTETYGNRTVRALTAAGKGFYLQPPIGFAEHPLLLPRGVLLIARADQKAAMDRFMAEMKTFGGRVARLGASGARAKVPVLREDYVVEAAFDTDAMDIDVHGLHGGYLRGLKARGGQTVVEAGVATLKREARAWYVECRAGQFRGRVIVNAAGAWADEVALLAGAQPIGLAPKRRTAILFQPPAGADVRGWPAVIDVDEHFYFRPDAGRLMASPADETPMPPCDVQPEELDIAILIDRLEKAAKLPVKRVEHRWAGLRTFAKDKTPVVGYDPKVEDFFWLAGQGGYGNQTAPGISRVVAELIRRRPVPADLADLGVAEMDLSPERFA